ncbi:MAG: hypothetical protein WAZ12_02810 [Candidatus Absconditicoccaceae bacterium]
MNREEKLKTLFNNGCLDGLFQLFIEKVGKDSLEGKTGGYFSIRYLDDHDTVVSKKIGKIDPEKKEKYQCLAPEKSLRLKKNLRNGHLTSYESRNTAGNVCVGQENRIEPWGHWGGAVYISKYFIFSFSGFPELLDEAFVCFLGMRSGSMSRNQFLEVKKRRTDNPYLKLL